MDTSMMLGLGALLVTAISGAGLVWYLLSAPQGKNNLSALRGQAAESENGERQNSLKGRGEPRTEVLEELKRKRKKKL